MLDTQLQNSNRRGCKITRLSSVAADAVCQLPSELWAKVFAHLKPVCTDATDYCARSDDSRLAVANLLYEQALYHQLKLVCSKFHQVFVQQPELSEELILGKGNAGRMLPSVLVYLQQHFRSVLAFRGLCGGSTQDMILAALACPSPQLCDVTLVGISQAALCTLSAHTSLRRCDISRPAEGSLDLQPLQTLPCLEDLSLQSGTFSDVCITPKLKYLFVDSAEVSFDQDSGLAELQGLQVHHSRLHEIHTVGLAACRGLTTLCVSNCWISALNAEDDLVIESEAAQLIPAQMSI